ncbi:copper resistance protein CopC [soil metagenome]
MMSSRPVALVAAILSAIVVTVATTFTLASSASAHAALQSSNPKDGSTIESMPSRVTFTLNEKAKSPAYVVVTSSDGKRINSEEVTVSGSTVTSEITQDAPAGKYTAAYRIVSADAHPVKGQIDFTIAGPKVESETPVPAASATSTPTVPETETETTVISGGGSPASTDQLIIILFFGVLASIITVLVVRGIRARDSE